VEFYDAKRYPSNCDNWGLGVWPAFALKDLCIKKVCAPTLFLEMKNQPTLTLNIVHRCKTAEGDAVLLLL